MRFGVPRSPSPSPVRATVSFDSKPRTFRAPPSDFSSSDEYQSEDDDNRSYASSSDWDVNDVSEISVTFSVNEHAPDWDGELNLGGDEDVAVSRKTTSRTRNTRRKEDEDSELADKVAAIRIQVQHKDPYDDWERQTRKDAFLSARKAQALKRFNLMQNQTNSHVLDQQRLLNDKARELDQLESQFRRMDAEKQQNERSMTEAWKQRDQELWHRIDQVIKEEEVNLRKKLEEERRAAEEAEKRRKEEEAKRRAEEEKTRVEEEKRRKQEEEKRKQEQERQEKLLQENIKKEQERKEREERTARERARMAQEQSSKEARSAASLLSASELWLIGMRRLKVLKTQTMRVIKGPKAPDPLPDNYVAPPAPPVKKLWSAQRRKITPKVGQLTNGTREIMRISEEIRLIVAPISGTPEELHHALLSSLAKTIIRQAETEVTAKKESAGPLAQITIQLIIAYPLFGEIFFAKLCELVGCWVAPLEALDVDAVDGSKLTEKQYSKVWSKRSDEIQDHQIIRISGVMRLYFHMLFVPVMSPLAPPYRPARFWSYFTQMLATKELIQRPLAAEILCVALDVGGLEAAKIWGRQWIKLLAFLHTYASGDQKERIGGPDPAAQAARVRILLEIDKITSS